jgi:hypothetical protein
MVCANLQRWNRCELTQADSITASIKYVDWSRKDWKTSRIGNNKRGLGVDEPDDGCEPAASKRQFQRLQELRIFEHPAQGCKRQP